MSYKPKYIFIYKNDEDLEKLLSEFQFRKELIVKKGREMIQYEHYNLILKKIKTVGFTRLYNLRGYRVAKVILTRDVYDEIVQNNVNTIHDVLEPITATCKMVGESGITLLE